jgi:hypothetical protein
VAITVTNVPPPKVPFAVSFWYPTNGQSFLAPANVGVHALVTDSNVVHTMRYFANGSSIGVVTNTSSVLLTNSTQDSPFFLSWSNVLAGSYTLTALATDSQGNTSTSAPVNIIVLTNRIPDTTRPTLSLSISSSVLQVSNAAFTVYGTAGDNVAVATVVYSLNQSGWSSAATTNGWTNWTAPVILLPGTNTFAAYAVDTSGNVSLTNKATLVYVVSATLAVSTNGLGYLYPNDNGALLQVGKNYAITATPGAGFMFTNWTGGTNLPLGFITNKATVQFSMVSNLMLQANFLDVQRPVLSITNLASGQRVSNAVFTVRGRASDNWAVSNVWLQLNGGSWTSAAGTTNWSAGLNLTPGTNSVQAFAVDTSGNRSLTNTLNLDFVVTNQLGLQITGLGTLSPNDSNAWLEVGRNYTITAVPAAGFLFTNWTVSTNWQGGATTNKPTVQFMMASNLTLAAGFVDVTPPTVIVTNLTNGQRLNSGSFTVMGKASDNWQVAGVYYNLNHAGWTDATGTTNWSAAIYLLPGVNTLSVYAVDNSGNYSLTNTLTLPPPSWVGADDFTSSHASAGNWTFDQAINGQMTVAVANDHASFLETATTTNYQKARLIWKGTPSVTNDWTAQVVGHNQAGYSAWGPTALRLVAIDTAMVGNTTNPEAIWIEVDRGLDLANLTPVTPASNFLLRLVYHSASGQTEGWLDSSGVGTDWTLLYSTNLALAAPQMTSNSTFSLGIAGRSYYGPITEGQLYAGDFSLTNGAFEPVSQDSLRPQNAAARMAAVTAQPVVLMTNPRLTAGGLTFNLQITGIASGLIQASTNLTSWETLTTFTGTNTTINFRDPAAANSSLRFYRAVAP